MKLLSFTLATLLATSAYAVETNTSTSLTQSKTQKASLPTTLKETLESEEKPVENVPPFVQKETYTIEEIHQWRKNLAGQTISLEATVYKVSRGIMKLDWVHLGDGSGEEKKLTDDLVFTTDSTSIKAGDRVLAKGKVIVDKDFGFGYFYKVIIQEASFTPKESK